MLEDRVLHSVSDGFSASTFRFSCSVAPVPWAWRKSDAFFEGWPPGEPTEIATDEEHKLSVPKDLSARCWLPTHAGRVLDQSFLAFAISSSAP